MSISLFIQIPSPMIILRDGKKLIISRSPSTPEIKYASSRNLVETRYNAYVLRTRYANGTLCAERTLREREHVSTLFFGIINTLKSAN